MTQRRNELIFNVLKFQGQLLVSRNPACRQTGTQRRNALIFNDLNIKVRFWSHAILPYGLPAAGGQTGTQRRNEMILNDL